MPLVEVPQHGVVEFPEDMSADEISSAIQANFPDLNTKPFGSVASVLAGESEPRAVGELREKPKPESYLVRAPSSGNILTTPVSGEPLLVRHPKDFAEGLYNTLAKGGTQLITPLAAILGPASRIPGAQTVIAGTLAGLGAKSVGATLGEMSARENPTPGQTAEGVGDVLQSALMMLPAVAKVAPHLTPLTIKALETTGAKNASEVIKTTEVHGDLQSQSDSSAGQVPTESSSAGVQPQRAVNEPGPENVPQQEPGTAGILGPKPPQTVESVAALAPAEFRKAFSKGFTETALKMGAETDPAVMERLLTELDSKRAAAQAAAESGDEQALQEYADLGSQRQFVSEALQGRGEAELIGMGAAKYGEVSGEGNPDIYGVAERVREERAKAGQVEPVPPGEGISAPDSVQHGRELIKQDPAVAESSLSQFESDKRLSSDAMAAVRAKGEQLALEARRAEEKFGTDSEEYKTAYKALSDWDARTKPMQTEWHKIGMAQQGETDIDTGSFTGLQRAYESGSGKQFTEPQSAKAKTLAGAVSKATKETNAARVRLADEIKTSAPKGVTISDAEARAKAAVHRQHQEASIREAQAENKHRVAEQQLKNAVEQVQRDAAEQAQAAIQKQHREAAIREARAENRVRIESQKPENSGEQVQRGASKKALEAANKTVNEAAIRRAREANKQRVVAAKRELEAAQKELSRARKLKDEASKRVREAAIRSAKMARKLQANPDIKVWNRAKEYLEKGIDDFDEIRNKVATDLGMSTSQVTRLLAYNKRARFLSDDLWTKQQKERLLKEQAKRWVHDTAIPLWKRTIQNVPRALFSLKVGFHGTVALGTHAPMVAFQPRFWQAYVRNFATMYKMVGSRAHYEMQIQDLLRRPNYITARRAGLVNDPYQYEDFNSPDTSKYIAGMTQMGNRGYSVLKILRQDMFDQFWNKLPKTTQIPEVAKAIADGVNHATGVVKGRAPVGSNVVLFAPRLAASRVMWLAGDPLKSAEVFAKWGNATPAEKQFAINQVKEKAWVAGTLYGLLALNQGFLSATGSKQEINFTDPFHSDFLKFKAAGMKFSYGNAMLSMARLPVRLYKIRESDGGKLKNLIYPDEDTYSVLGEYSRSQLSPFASLATTLWLKGDWQNRPLPTSNRPVPKRLRAQGIGAYTWPEFWSEQVLPIPAEEAAREVWKHGMGMSHEQIVNMRKALATIAVMSATGGRLEDDVEYNKDTKPK